MSAEQPDEASRNQRFAAILMDLDRCEHGRHQGDACSDCQGFSHGNPFLPDGDQIGFTIDGDPIVVPDREHKHDPAAWKPGATRG